MATILQLVQSAALLCDLEVPQTVFSNTDRTWQEMANTVNIATRQILTDYDWRRLIKTTTITGDGVATSFPLPVDYDRMVDDTELVGPDMIWYPSMQIQEFSEWLRLQYMTVETWQQRWMMYGGELHILPVLGVGVTVAYGYVTLNVVNGADPTLFTADSDTFVLDDELLRLAIIWNWKKSKGFDFAAELAEYSERLSSLKYSDVGSRQAITSGRRWRWPTGVTF